MRHVAWPLIGAIIKNHRPWRSALMMPTLTISVLSLDLDMHINHHKLMDMEWFVIQFLEFILNKLQLFTYSHKKN